MQQLVTFQHFMRFFISSTEIKKNNTKSEFCTKKFLEFQPKKKYKIERNHIFGFSFEIVFIRVMKVRDAGLERCRTDLHLTSTGKGHYYEGEKPFPPPSFGE